MAKEYQPFEKVQKILEKLDQGHFSLNEETLSLKPINSDINKNLIQKTELKKENNLPKENITKKIEQIPQPKSAQLIVSKRNLDLQIEGEKTDKNCKKNKKMKKNNIWEKFLK